MPTIELTEKQKAILDYILYDWDAGIMTDIDQMLEDLDADGEDLREMMYQVEVAQ